MKFQGTGFYVKSHDEMFQVFKDSPDVLARTLGIAERCSVRLDKVSNPFPHFDVPDGYSLDSYFEQVTREGFALRMEAIRGLSAAGKLKHGIGEYEQRLAREIAIIQQMKFSGYFLIVWDFVRYARENSIPVGPGRGSAAGSLVSYSLRITDLDPLEHELFFVGRRCDGEERAGFERFKNVRRDRNGRAGGPFGPAEEGEQHPRWAWPWFRCRIVSLLLAAHHRS